MDELESYNQEFKKRLDEIGALGDIPDDLALEVMFYSRVLYFYSSVVALYSVTNDCSSESYLAPNKTQFYSEGFFPRC
jgi:hypothetical protein